MTTPSLDDFLDSTLDSLTDAAAETDSFLDSTVEHQTIVEVEGIDPRLKQLSHSSRTTLHKCPRKYQLYRLNSKDSGEEDREQGVTFAYGSAVGVGIQSTLENKTEDQIILDTFLAWDVDLLDENQRQKKSFWLAVFAVQRFMQLREEGYLADYELVYYNGKPAVELSFRITLPGGYTYRGYVDGVLRNTKTGEILVLECKTSSGNPNSAQYKNSGQALGYSVILDKLFPELSAYEVLYLVYGTKQLEYTEFYFEKSLLLRALWLQELLIDTQHIELYEHYQTYPMHGESCYDFFRECEYLGLCTLSTDKLVKPLTQQYLDKLAAEEYMFEVDFDELVRNQIEKGDL